MKKVVIIGANSYIARNLLFILKKKKGEFEIKLYDNLMAQADGAKNYRHVDILLEKSVSGIDLNCDIVFMFTGKTGSADGFDNANTFVDVNERALLNILNEYRRQRSKAKIIFPSTRLIYKGKKGLLSENDEKEFKTIYAINKYTCEQYLEQYNRVFGVKYCIFRICIPYGTLVSNISSYGTVEFMINQVNKSENISLYGDGSARRTLTYIGDLCETLVKGALSEQCINDVYNIGGENYSLLEMAELIADRYCTGIDFIPWPDIALKIESGDTVFDDTKLKMKIGDTVHSKFSDWVSEMNRDK